jgi:O-antigen ligase
VRSNISLICILGMVAGLLASHLTLSVATFLYGINAIWGVSPREWFRNKWWLLGLGWVGCYAISGLWSTDMHHWWAELQIMLPMLLLPLVVSLGPLMSPRQMSAMALGVSAILLSGIGYSLSFLVRDPQHYILQYGVSHLLPAPCYDDHIRFSLTITLFTGWCVYAWPYLSKAVKWITGICIALFITYLHVLAARSGIFSLYLFLGMWGLYTAFARRKIAGIIAIAAIPTILFLAGKFIRTFSIRLQYQDYSIGKMAIGDNTGHYGDINRLYSYDVSMRLIRQHPWAGVGAGDMTNEMRAGYARWYPQIESSYWLVPHNQFLMVTLGCGIVALGIFVVWVFYPLTFLRRRRSAFFLFSTWIILLFSLTIEPMLEIQNGMWVFLFFLTLQMMEMRRETDEVPLHTI